MTNINKKQWQQKKESSRIRTFTLIAQACANVEDFKDLLDKFEKNLNVLGRSKITFKN